MAVTREFYINLGLFLLSCIALVLSIWTFIKPKQCKNDSFRNIEDLPPPDEKASTTIRLDTPPFGTGGTNPPQRPSQKEKENAQSLLLLTEGGNCLQCYQYKKGSLASYFYSDYSFNDSIVDPNNKLPANHLINLGYYDSSEYTSDLPCDTLTRLRKPECNP